MAHLDMHGVSANLAFGAFLPVYGSCSIPDASEKIGLAVFIQASFFDGHGVNGVLFCYPACFAICGASVDGFGTCLAFVGQFSPASAFIVIGCCARFCAEMIGGFLYLTGVFVEFFIAVFTCDFH